MPKVNSLDESFRYSVRPNQTPPARRTAYDQHDRRPTTAQGTGQQGVDLPAERGTAGEMNKGGKRRPGHNARKGID